MMNVRVWLMIQFTYNDLRMANNTDGKYHKDLMSVQMFG